MKRKDIIGVPKKRRKKFDKNASAYRKMLVSLVVRITGDKVLAEDIAQQAILNYLRVREQDGWQEEVKNEPAYLKEIARNLLKDKWKAQSKTRIVSLDQDLDPETRKSLRQHTKGFDVDNQIYLEELWRTLPLKTIFRGFTESQMQLLRRRDVERLSFEEIGTLVNENPIVVRYEHQRIHATIRARIKKIFGDDTGFFKANV